MLQGSSETMSTYKVFTIPDSLTEISVEVTALAGFNCFYVIITECDDPEVGRHWLPDSLCTL